MPKLFMLLIGASPPGRNIEQHDVFFGIGETINDLAADVIAFWPGDNKLHVDAWREVTSANGYKIEVELNNRNIQSTPYKLFFINLGGYKQNEFEEFHYKMVIAAVDKVGAVKISKKTAFFRHTGFKGAPAHIDDKYGVDVDDVYEIRDILPATVKGKYKILVTPDSSIPEDEIHPGYFRLSMFQ
ncbi:MAG TPA: DUF1543 domain-containing protein [Chitinophagaceae bacterium]|nr:DUF1543 domain-containing protein [Chitinophagaceae bacterium]